MPVMKMNDYQFVSRKTAIYPENQGFVYCVLGLVGESGEIADKLKKVIRDKNSQLGEEEIMGVAKELGDVLWYVSNLSHELGFSLEEIAQMNVDKLQSRMKRNKLSGSGDDR